MTILVLRGRSMTATSAYWWQVTDFSRMALCDVHLDVRVRQGDDEAKDLVTAHQRRRVRVRFRALRTICSESLWRSQTRLVLVRRDGCEAGLCCALTMRVHWMCSNAHRVWM